MYEDWVDEALRALGLYNKTFNEKVYPASPILKAKVGRPRPSTPPVSQLGTPMAMPTTRRSRSALSTLSSPPTRQRSHRRRRS